MYKLGRALGEKTLKPANPVNLGCQTRRMALEARSLLGESVVIPGVCTHKVASV